MQIRINYKLHIIIHVKILNIEVIYFGCFLNVCKKKQLQFMAGEPNKRMHLFVC